jgi:glycerophosphoryl diester phosphodiesterase
VVIAHRGASEEAPEHTLAAYDLALAQGADALELDVRATADGELVVLHDPTLARTHGDPRPVAEVRLGDLPPEARPLRLADVLDRYGTATRWLLETKVPVEREVVDAVVRRGLGGHAELQTFDRAGLLRAGGRLRRALLLAPGAAPPRRLGGLDTLGPWHGDVDAALVARLRARGVRVQPWTVNDAAEAARLRACGADALITDVPARIAAVSRAAAA